MNVLTLTCPLCAWSTRQEADADGALLLTERMMRVLLRHLRNAHGSDPFRPTTQAISGPFYIWSVEHCAWWLPTKRGYTDALLDAGRFPYDEARRIVDQANIVHFHECMVPVSCAQQLTPSQVLALTDIVAHYMLYPTSSDTFVDVINRVDTHIEDLLGELLKLRGMR